MFGYHKVYLHVDLRNSGPTVWLRIFELVVGTAPTLLESRRDDSQLSLPASIM